MPADFKDIAESTEIAAGYRAGAIGRIVEMHGTYYSTHWGFGLFFEAKVATELSEFLSRYDDRQDGFWTVIRRGRVEGAIAIDGVHGADGDGHLRWFILSDTQRGNGFGNQLLETAVEFCRHRDYRRIYLWTFEGLNPARHLYEKYGFALVEQRTGRQWGTEVVEQRFELIL